MVRGSCPRPVTNKGVTCPPRSSVFLLYGTLFRTPTFTKGDPTLRSCGLYPPGAGVQISRVPWTSRGVGDKGMTPLVSGPPSLKSLESLCDKGSGTSRETRTESDTPGGGRPGRVPRRCTGGPRRPVGSPPPTPGVPDILHPESPRFSGGTPVVLQGRLPQPRTESRTRGTTRVTLPR